MTRDEVIRFLIFRTFGNFLVLFTIFGFFATFGPAVYYEATFRVAQAVGVRYQVFNEQPENETTSELGKLLEEYRETPNDEYVDDQESLLGTVLSENKEKILIPKSADFSIIIPKIGASSKIIENVDPSNEKEYLPALGKGVAHAKGTAFPGLGGNIYLFAHSADTFWNVGRYNAVFYLLKELKPGDEIYIFFMGRRYNYVVNDSRIVESTETQYLQANIGAGEQLILQTCWPPGTTWKRLLVFAKPK